MYRSAKSSNAPIPPFQCSRSYLYLTSLSPLQYDDGKDFGFEPGFGSPGGGGGRPRPTPSYPGPGPGPAYEDEPHLTFEMPRLDLDDEDQSPYHPTFPHNDIYKPSLNEEPFAFGPEVDVEDAYGPEIDVIEETFHDGPNEGHD